MVFSLTWLPEVLEAAGLKVAEVDGWRTRGRAEMGAVRGVICHHTAGGKTGNMPTLDLLVRGRSDLAGPLAQLGLGRDGTYYVIAAGRANHAGKGRWRGIDTGNSNFIGIEAENTGRADDTWPAVQLEAYHRGVAAILARIKADSSMCCGHKEYALPAGRKSDPPFEMTPFRVAVQAILSGQVPRPIPIPAIDVKSRPTLRRGDDGDLVKLAQRKLGVDPIGHFGPATEAAAREFQRQHGLVPDGILGPKAWAALDAIDGPAVASAPARPATAPTAPIAPIETTPPVAPGAPPIPSQVAMPALESAADPIRLSGKTAIAPDGERFAQAFGKGFFTTGRTSLAKWLADGDAASRAGLDDSRVRVVRAMCVNEGGLEAINSYDGCFMSFGIFQWTAGLDDASGELAVLLAGFKAASAEAYEDCFGRYRLDVDVAAGAHTGRLILDGHALATGAAKAQLRQPAWAYRFWRAGHHPALRAAQLSLAAGRIDRFTELPALGRPVGEWLTSQYGIALVLDEHVNRPGHVPRTLETALTAAFGAQVAAQTPAGWSEDDEAKLITAYIDARGHTNMTDSTKRAGRIGECIKTGQLSADRASFR